MSGAVADQTTLRGKRLQIYQRDEAHLEMAREIFLKEGFHRLTIARLANATGFSRGTLYERFGCKEGLMVELGLRCQQEMGSVLRRASRFPGRSRERAIALGEAIRHYAHLYEDNIRIVTFIDTDAVAARVSPDLRAKLAENELGMFLVLQAVVQDGVREGDVVPPTGTSATTLTLGLWTMIVGLFAAMRGSAVTEQLDLTDPYDQLSKNAHLLLDAYGWRPMSSEWDYEDSARRIHAYLEEKVKSEHPDGGQEDIIED